GTGSGLNPARDYTDSGSLMDLSSAAHEALTKRGQAPEACFRAIRAASNEPLSSMPCEAQQKPFVGR
ncbi:hypothetical protein, partial [uncultured Nevskia sp.]|uniref:hypothetical protein n=1 Tax=uncultured Nevskia sp. TaxID=228950 RepID=UPI0025ED0CCB